MNHQLTMISKKSGMVMGWERKRETTNGKGYKRGETKHRAEILIVLCSGKRVGSPLCRVETITLAESDQTVISVQLPDYQY